MVATATPVEIARAISPTSKTSSVHGSGVTIGKHRISTLRHTPPLCIEEELRGPPLSPNVVLLVQEWLRIAKLPTTSQCFVEEYTRVQNQPPPALEQWYEMTNAIDLTALTPIAPHDDQELANPALLERIVAHAFARFRRRQEATISKPPTTVVVSKRPATAALPLKFSAKRSLPMGGTSSIGVSKSTAALPSPATRPKSAVTVAASRSTPDLGVREFRGESEWHANNNTAEQSVTASKKQNAASSPPKSRPTSGHSITPQESTALPRPTTPKPTDSTRRKASQTLMSSPRRNDNDGRKQVVVNTGTPVQEKPNGEARPEDDELKSAVELEDMTEEGLSEHYRALSRSNIKKLRRVLAKGSAHSQELQRTRMAMDKIQLRAQQQHERSAFAAKQTELLNTTMDMLIKEPCSLCQYIFLKKNLTAKVSFKSICDLRASWAARHRKDRHESNARTASGSHLTSSPTNSSEEEIDNASEETMALETTQQISHLYDEVPVCVFCAQLALNFSSYRPTSAEQKERKETERRLAVEKHRVRELQRQRDRLKCDPLDFHTYELNSDEDDDDVETDEVLEVDANGRVQVVRRRRYRRRTARVAAATSLVSKRIHYDHMRSQSIHVLNRKEWEIISQSKREI